jgi:phosphoribosylanthranilate isomerase
MRQNELAPLNLVTRLSRMMRTRVKICGVTRPWDAQAAAAAGADAIGLVFYDRSPRAVDIAQAKAVLAALPPFVTTVGLFVDAPAAFVAEVLAAVSLDALQFHGDEPPSACSAYGRPWVKALRVRPGIELMREADRYGAAQALLLDAYRRGVPGGTGACFDWGLVPPELGPRIVLAGGLTPDNVAEAIGRVRPYAVDVSGGVESARGIKDHARIDAFMQGVRDGDRSR